MKYPAGSRRYRLLSLLVGSVWLLTSSEWLFLVTKPSFLSSLSWVSKARLALSAPLFPLLSILAVIVFLVVLRKPATWCGWSTRPFMLLALAPAGVLTLTVMMLAENFTVTLFGFGIAESKWLGKTIYLLLGTATFLYFWRKCLAWIRRRSRTRLDRASSLTALALVAISIIATVLTVRGDSVSIGSSLISLTGTEKKLPNILFLAVDGVEADKLSMYGYPRQTSPRVSHYFSDSLIFENALANGQNTASSVYSMLTGKLPTTTRLISSPHVLHGRHAFEHLPGLLRELGYHSFQETLRDYADAWDQNMLSSFDVVNGRSAGLPWLSTEVKKRFSSLGWHQYFVRHISRRITERVLHLLSIRHLGSHYETVRPFGKREKAGDETRIDRSIAFLEGGQRPFFGQVHLLSSHCCYYTPTLREFSARHPKDGIETMAEWRNQELQLDYFDDAVLSADFEIGRLLQWLESREELDDTLLVFSSDHSRFWTSDVRVPLMIRLPADRVSGRIRAPVQLLDVAPTVVDALDMPIPQWMEGRSLLDHEELLPDRPIFGVSQISFPTWEQSEEVWTRSAVWGPPLFGIKAVSMAVCGRFYEAMILQHSVEISNVRGWSLPCSPLLLPTLSRASEQIRLHLAERGFFDTD